MYNKSNLYIKVDLIKLTQEESNDQKIRASALNDEKMTEAERLARDILAPLAVAELMKREGTPEQKQIAVARGQLFAECSAVCSGALWFCGDADERKALTLADGFRPRAFGRCCSGACFVLILQNSFEEERAYLVRPSW